ncbi:DNA-3-methyladenine glycosylase [Tissierella simiarum]|uniref:DNA-3-methyladenine glycosylase n=1 Tax=Tissierella simiarum TaxID=2841534 RepID=UPI0031BB0ED5
MASLKLGREFYSRDTITVAKELLGKILVHDVDGQLIKGKIVETEAYLGLIDKAAHSYGGKKTKRLEAMYSIPGTSYIFFIYGMYYCFNVVTRETGIPEAVLVRGIEPVEGIDKMSNNRFGKNYEDLTNYQKKNLTNGPGKLSIAFNLDKSLDKEDLCGNRLYISEGEEEKIDIVETTRIGIDYAEEAKDWKLRFYIKNNAFVSKK